MLNNRSLASTIAATIRRVLVRLVINSYSNSSVVRISIGISIGIISSMQTSTAGRMSPKAQSPNAKLCPAAWRSSGQGLGFRVRNW